MGAAVARRRPSAPSAASSAVPSAAPSAASSNAPAPAAPPPAAGRTPWARASWFLYAVAVAGVALDQATKLLTAAYLSLGESVPVISGWFAITHVQNEGAAFSMFDGHVPILAVISAVVTVGLVVYERRLGPRPALQNVALACILSGAAGNLIDRVRVGRVVDMFDLQNGSGRNLWPVFNVADIALVVGVGLFLIATFRESRAARAAAAAEGGGAPRPKKRRGRG
jgi:signal peptidase II